MKPLFRIFDLSKNEQRVVLIVIFVLLALTFIGYERRINQSPVLRTPLSELKPSPSPVEIDHER
jgi:hypothetical protein